MMPFFLVYRSRMFASGSRWHFFEQTRRLPSVRMTTQYHVHFGGFGLVGFFVSARCKPVHSGDYIELFLDHEFKLRKRKSACLNQELEVPHIACAVAMSPNKQHVKRHRQSGLGDILLRVLFEFKRFPQIECQTRLMHCGEICVYVNVYVSYFCTKRGDRFGGYSF